MLARTLFDIGPQQAGGLDKLEHEFPSQGSLHKEPPNVSLLIICWITAFSGLRKSRREIVKPSLPQADIRLAGTSLAFPGTALLDCAQRALPREALPK